MLVEADTMDTKRYCYYQSIEFSFQISSANSVDEILRCAQNDSICHDGSIRQNDTDR